ncbi:hypothetical protein N7481_008882 [Penicillium waksmanii]|uniref:uncharacterized protein n=1 Tax=Penicillium waksmanii TaxID=69791 RepID=UPI002549C027|nr:uncharacterized protein N7481_008882 [Penicillium waksmanii]KAJ5975175.1 hypothetical protein N7481_008882 [Penicillium waksmanii]
MPCCGIPLAAISSACKIGDTGASSRLVSSRAPLSEFVEKKFARLITVAESIKTDSDALASLTSPRWDHLLGDHDHTRRLE